MVSTKLAYHDLSWLIIVRTAVLFAFQSYLVETPAQKATAATPSILSVAMSSKFDYLCDVGVCSQLIIRSNVIRSGKHQTSRLISHAPTNLNFSPTHLCSFHQSHKEVEQVPKLQLLNLLHKAASCYGFCLEYLGTSSCNNHNTHPGMSQ
jgi:hypothetical protein